MAKTKIAELLDLIEFYSTFGRPDASGDRKGFTGVKKMPLSRAPNSPYDKQNSYGATADYDRGSVKRSEFHAKVVLPHDVSHSAWDDVAEAMGTTINYGKSGNSQIGNSTGIPGASGGWANNPKKPWDENDEEKFKMYDESCLDMTINPATPNVEPISNVQPEYNHDQTDDDIEKKVDKLWNRNDNNNFKMAFQQEPDIYIVQSPNEFSNVAGLRTSRGLYGLIPKESVWVEIAKLFNKANVK